MRPLQHFGIISKPRRDIRGRNMLKTYNRRGGVDIYDEDGEIMYSNSEYDPEDEQ
jgi:hypothetical protein